MGTLHGDSGEGGQEPVPGVAELLEQLSEAVRTLGALAAVIRAVALRPPVELHVERLEVENLEFRLGDIDVEELQGELNIGITQSLRQAPPANPTGERPPAPRAPSSGPSARSAGPPVGSAGPPAGSTGPPAGSNGPPAGSTGPPAPKRVQLWPPPETEGSDKR